MPRKFFILLYIILAVAFMLINRPSLALDYRWKKNVADGIEYIHLKKMMSHGWVHVHILKVDYKSSDIRVKAAFAKNTIGNIEPTNLIAKRSNAIAAINGSFFEAKRRPHLPIGIIAVDGQIMNKSTLPRCAFGITSGGDLLFDVPKIQSRIILARKNKSFDIWGINRPRKENEVVLYTDEYGEETKTNDFGVEIVIEQGKVLSIAKAKGNSNIPKNGCVISLHGASRRYVDWFDVGEDVLVEFNLGESWQMIDQIVSGGPLLIKDGKMVVKRTVIEEIFKGTLLKRAARTAIGETKDKKLMMVVADKRRGISNGVFYSELSRILLEEGAWNAMGLDGGSSSTMFLDGQVVSYPSAGIPVSVSNAIVVNKAGYKYVAKKPMRILSKPKTVAIKEAAITKMKSASPEVLEISTMEVVGEIITEDGLIQIYNLLLRPMVPTFETKFLE